MASSTLPPLISVSGLVSLYGVRARSQLGQNFLFDANVTGTTDRSRPDIINPFNTLTYSCSCVPS